MCSESRKYPDAFSFQVVAETDWRKFNFVAGMVPMMKSLMKEVITCLFSNEVPYEFWPKVPKLTVRFRPLEICVENMVKNITSSKNITKMAVSINSLRIGKQHNSDI